MKNSIILFITTALLLSSCQNFLNEEVRAAYSEETFYQTQAQALQALNAAYQTLTFATDNNRLWVFGDVASDDAAKGGDPGDQADIGLVDEFQVYPNNGPLEAEWGLLYEGISRCNRVIQRVPNISMDATLKARIIGEARFLRALNYFYLVNIYGPVPLILEPKNADELQIEQSPVVTIYTQAIEADLTAAAQALPATYAGNDVGRATKGAAQALLAKAYLFQQKWQQAADMAGLVINSGQYSLLPVYAQNFQQTYKNSPETVFSVQHLAGQVPFTGNRLNQWFAPRVNENGYFFNVPTQNFVDEFEKTTKGVVDPRLDYTVARPGKPWLDGITLVEATWSPTGFLNKKHVQPLSEIPKSTKGDGNLNYITLRFAEVLLIQAEALNELGQSANALLPLNRVRQRARESYLNDPMLHDSTQTQPGGKPTIPTGLLPNVTNTAQSSLREFIRHERRVELGFEFGRYFDIMRYGKEYAQAALRDKPSFKYETNRYFPIPQSERDTNKKLRL